MLRSSLKFSVLWKDPGNTVLHRFLSRENCECDKDCVSLSGLWMSSVVSGSHPLKCINPLSSELSLHFTEDLAGLCPVGSSGFWRNMAAHKEDLLNRFPHISSQY